MELKTALLVLLLLVAACTTPGVENEESNNRKSAEVNTALGQGYLEREQYEVALEKLKKAVAYDRSYAPAHTVLGLLYERLGELEQAEKEYAAAVKYDPSDGDTNNNYGSFLCRVGKGKNTEKYFLKAIEDPFYQTPEIAYSNAGICWLAQGNLDKAEFFLRQSLEYDDKLPLALISMANVSYQTGNFMRARAFLQRYGSVETWDENSLLLGYQNESKLGDSESANRYRLELLERFPLSSQAGQVSGREEE